MPRRRSRRPRRPWRRRLRRLVLLGGAAAGIASFRNRQVARNEELYGGPEGPRDQARPSAAAADTET